MDKNNMNDLELYNRAFEASKRHDEPLAASVQGNQNDSLCSRDGATPKPARLDALAATISATYARKNADYGDSFGKSVQRYGLISALTRMSDKWNRLETLILNRVNGGNGPMVKDEALTDTLMDLATYCLMTVMELDE